MPPSNLITNPKGRFCLVVVEAHKKSGLDRKKISVKLQIFFCPSVLTYVLGVQKNRLIEAVLLSDHNIYFG